MPSNRKSPEGQQPPWFLALKWLSYLLLAGCGSVVFLGSVYVLFFAPVQTVAQSSLNRDAPLWQKASYLVMVLVIVFIGYVINQLVWGRLSPSSRGTDNGAQTEQEGMD
jgi:polyferredoxin